MTLGVPSVVYFGLDKVWPARGADAGKAQGGPTARGNARIFCSLYGGRPPIVLPVLFLVLQNFLFLAHSRLGSRFMYK